MHTFAQSTLNANHLELQKTALLQLAKRLPRKVEQTSHEQLLFRGVTPYYTESRPPWKEIAKGILPSLRHMANQGSKIGYKEKCVLLQNPKFMAKDQVPESHLNPITRPIDPFGNDYACKICDRDLANTYFHCEGCEKLLKEDYNICDECFTEDRFKCNTAMKHEKLTELTSDHCILEKSRRKGASLVDIRSSFPSVRYAKSVRGANVVVTGIKACTVL